ncbi:thiamine phosphate synthase [Paenibacillus alvei]|uniref:Thiamine-phosphate synthase n=1 Tax=Paenibacillus alvei TaxID=44250 RepID=A0ABT4GXW2_PAEAL|nr:MULTISPECIES: thiamine phosphate synthase [Paenibacillus]EJW20140.1 thiamine-phosphate synthase ThiE [Paenibacillus alvei DSM 29]MCY7486256.1 thiamine phosphate synthase [Paenibacillus alvei]MCY9539519.1 thiamine phosphate synthase [Paenibacillus alvei]MCY9703966.1 thiamine phosphate synthase [Paenibacillus alvei]MCY9733964.1 thiamine phosphate synthase [Paenibacillus alvei]
MTSIESRIDEGRMRSYLRLYLVLGSSNCKTDPASVVEEAIRGGATMIQFREKGSKAARLAAKEDLARRIQAICRRHGVPFIVNDDVELALALNADGVHIGQDDEPAAQVRERIGDKILGVSVHSTAEARLAEELGADYLGVGPIYPTASKEDAQQPQGTEIIQRLTKLTSMPIVAIGGITADRAPHVIQAGADGVAVISAITHAENIYQAAKILASRATG